MLHAGFSPSLSADMVKAIPTELPSPQAVQQALQQQIESRLQVVDPLSVFDPGGIFAFVGPTGVGKTTAIAKIAARCVLRYGRDQLALLTTDTFRIGAQEQLQVYAKIIGVPVATLRDSEDLASKIKTLGQRHIVLLDTTGVNQRDIRMLEQSQLLQQGAPELKRILVVSSTTDLRTQEDVILMHQQAARSAQGGSILAALITKTDEAAQLGPAVDCLIRHQLPLMFLANGQRVPEDLSPANLPYLSHRALHPRALGDDLSLGNEQLPALMADQLSQWKPVR
jgi:flagellar biosynthesis protein FlhF